MAGTLAPLLGGFASRPAERFRLFDTDFFRSYPYFLPTAVAAVFPVAASILGLFALKETLPPRKKEKDRPPVSTLFTRRLILVLSAWGSICALALLFMARHLVR